MSNRHSRQECGLHFLFRWRLQGYRSAKIVGQNPCGYLKVKFLPRPSQMNKTAETFELMDRPITVSIASVLLVLNVLILTGWWAIAPDQVESNGAQVFFTILWLSVGISVFRGFGWVRYATLAVLVIFFVEILNTGEPLAALLYMPLGDQASKSLALVAVLLLFLPQSNQWYKQIREYAKSLESKESGKAK